MCAYKDAMKSRIEFQLSEAYKIHMKIKDQKKEENRYYLLNIIDISFFLSKQCIPFRGHNESVNSDNGGNFKELLKLMCKRDPHLKYIREKIKYKYDSSLIQNQIFEIISIVCPPNLKLLLIIQYNLLYINLII